MQVIDPRELNDLAAFASRGGLGHGIALTDCVAEQPDQLMYLSGDSLILLRDLGPIALASCEGVVGWVNKEHVRFERIAGTSSTSNSGPLVVDQKPNGSSTDSRATTSRPSPPTPTPALALALPVSSSPERKLISIPTSDQAKSGHLAVEEMKDKRHLSNPFDLDSPAPTPSVEATQKGFNLPTGAPLQGGMAATTTRTGAQDTGSGIRGGDFQEDSRLNRESMDSVGSSSFGGIGGFMMGREDSDEGEDPVAALRGSPGLTEMADSPVPPSTHAVQTPQSVILSTPSKPLSLTTALANEDDFSPTSIKSQVSAQSAGSWDIYDTYSRESVYGKRDVSLKSPLSPVSPLPSIQPPQAVSTLTAPVPNPNQKQSQSQRKETPSVQSVVSPSVRDSVISAISNRSSWDDEGRAFEAARLALQKVGLQRRWTEEEEEEEGDSPKKAGTALTPGSVINGDSGKARSGSELSLPGEAQTYPQRRGSHSGSTESHTSTTSDTLPPPRPARRRPMGIDMAGGMPELKNLSPAKSTSQSQSKSSSPTTSFAPETPKAVSRATSPVGSSAGANANSERFAALNIQVPRHGSVVEVGPMTPPVIIRRDTIETPRRLKIANPDSDDDEEETPQEDEVPSASHSSDGNHTADTSIELVTPIPPGDIILPGPITVDEGDTESASSDATGLGRESPMQRKQEVQTQTPLRLSPPNLASPRRVISDTHERPRSKIEPFMALTDPSERDKTMPVGTPKPGPPRRSVSAQQISSSASLANMIPPTTPWKPGSPASPHSIDATRQAVEAVRKTPEAKRARGMTLVGRMEADLSQATGPVPITFLIGDHTTPVPIPVPCPSTSSSGSVGLGLPRLIIPPAGAGGGHGRHPPHPERKGSGQGSSPTTHPLASPFMDIENPTLALKITPSPYPPHRSATNPLPPTLRDTTTEPPSNGMPKPGFFPRPRSRSFSAAVSKALNRKAGPGLTIKTDIPGMPSMPSASATMMQNGPISAGPGGGPGKRPFFSRQASMPGHGNGSSSTLAPSGSSSHLPTTPISPAMPLSPDMIGISNHHSNDSTASLVPPPSARSSSFSFRKSRGSKTPTITGPGGSSSTVPTFAQISPSRPLPSPVSNKDYEDTVKADGLDFEIIQPKSKGSLLSPSNSMADNSVNGNGNGGGGGGEGADLERKGTVVSATSGRSLRTLPDTDEWGFIRDHSPTPEIFTGRAGGAEQRALEMKWLSIINTPLASGSQPPKKVRKMAIESGIPASLRGRVWAWFMSPMMSARRQGLYQELLDHDREDKRLAERIEKDVEAAYPDHSIYSETSTGQSDLSSILRAYSHFATGGYRSEMSLIAGMLLIHCVAEDAFWLLSGFVNGVLKDYYASSSGAPGGKAVGMRVDAAVFAGVLYGSEPKLGKLFKDIGLHPIMFLEEWYSKLFIRCLPWPTALRVIDAVVAEGPRFLLIASLTVLTLSRDRLLALPRTFTDVLAYLKDVPQDALFLPEGFMKACENVKFKDEDLKRLRVGVEKEMGIA